ncbi:MAG: hypothetical protein GY906_14470, partial [bacterium]|nr:hypothetical protein [bacterium]
YVANRLEAHLEVTGTRDRLLLMSADRLFFQIVLVSLLERVSAVESCRLVLHFSDRRLDPMVTLTREQWENATDFSVEGFWRLVETENADRLWEEP